MRIFRALSAAIIVAVAGCDERNVITEKDPFFQRSLAFDEAKSDRVIAEVRSFSEDHKMDFLLSRDEPDAGDFNASANGRTINLKAMHVQAVGDGLAIFAIARDVPSQRDLDLTKEFVCRVAGDCAPDNLAVSKTSTR